MWLLIYSPFSLAWGDCKIKSVRLSCMCVQRTIQMNSSTGSLNCTWKQFVQICNKTKLPTNSCTFLVGESTEKQTLKCKRWTWQWLHLPTEHSTSSLPYTYIWRPFLFVHRLAWRKQEDTWGVLCPSVYAQLLGKNGNGNTPESYPFMQGITCITHFWLERHFESSWEIKKFRFHL